MKKVVSLAVACAILGVAHLGVQSVVESSVKGTLEQRIASVSESSNQKIEYSNGNVYFDYLSMSATMEKLEMYIGGKPGVATLLVDKYQFNPFTSQMVFHDVVVLSNAPQGGAFAMASSSNIELESEKSDGSVELTNFKIAVNGLKVSDKIYSQFTSVTAAPLFEHLFNEKGANIAFKLSKVGQSADATLSIFKENLLSISGAVSYAVMSVDMSGSFIDPDTGEKLKTGAASKVVEQHINKLSLNLTDSGIRQKAFAWGAGLSDSPSVDDAEKFKEGLVRGTDAYINQVIPYHFLPLEVMNSFVEFISTGESVDFSVAFSEPVPMNKLLPHIQGYVDNKIFDKATVEIK